MRYIAPILARSNRAGSGDVGDPTPSRGVPGAVAGYRRRPGNWLCVLLLAASIILSGCGTEAEEVPPEVEIGTEPGNRAPPLSGTLADGGRYALEDRPDAPTVLVFYRGAQCGLCRLQLEQAQRHLPAYEYQGARIVGVTLDPPEQSQALLDEVEIGFNLVSVDRDAFQSWGVTAPGEEAPLPATFIVDRDGIVRFRHIGRNAADRTSDAGILTVLQELQ
jgi:peroxiredoxin